MLFAVLCRRQTPFKTPQFVFGTKRQLLRLVPLIGGQQPHRDRQVMRLTADFLALRLVLPRGLGQRKQMGEAVEQPLPPAQAAFNSARIARVSVRSFLLSARFFFICRKMRTSDASRLTKVASIRAAPAAGQLHVDRLLHGPMAEASEALWQNACADFCHFSPVLPTGPDDDRQAAVRTSNRLYAPVVRQARLLADLGRGFVREDTHHLPVHRRVEVGEAPRRLRRRRAKAPRASPAAATPSAGSGTGVMEAVLVAKPVPSIVKPPETPTRSIV